MKTRLFIFILLASILCPFANTHAQEVAIVRSAGIKPYDEAVRGFKNTCEADAIEFTISRLNDKDIAAKVREIKPRLILAIGLEALSRVKKITDIPIIYAMVSNPQAFLSGPSRQKNITGISMNVRAEKQLRTLLEVSPEVKRIGLVYDQRKTAELFNEARAAASSLGITVVSKNVSNAKEVPTAINGMKGRIDAFWILPDTTVISQESMEFLLLFSFENKLPTLVFSEKYVEFGFLTALDIDALDIGRQSGELANRVLMGENTSAVSMTLPEKAVLSLNLKTAKKLGLHIGEDVIRRAKIIQ